MELAKENDVAQTLVKGSLEVFIGSVLARLAGIIYSITVIRWLSPKDYGILAFVLTLISFIWSYADPHIGLATIKYYSESKRQAKEFIVNCFWYYFIVGLFLSIILTIFSDPIANFFAIKSASYAIALGGFIIFFMAIENFYACTFTSHLRLDYEAFRRVLKQSLLVLLVIITLLLGCGVFGVLWAWILSGVVTYSILIWPLSKVFDCKKLLSKPNKAIMLKLIPFGFSLYIASFIWQTFTSVDTFLISFFLKEEDIGYYNAAMRIAKFILLIPMALVTPMVPLVSELSSQSISEGSSSMATYRLSDSVRKSIKYVICLITPVIIIVCSYPNYVIDILFGSKYLRASFPLQLLMIAIFFQSIYVLFDAIFIGLGMVLVRIVLSSIATLLNFMLCYILIPIYGIEGAAFSAVISSMLVAILAICRCSRKLPTIEFELSLYAKFISILLSAFTIFFIFIHILSTFLRLVLVPISLFTLFIYYVMLVYFNVITTRDLLIFSQVRLLSFLARIGFKIKQAKKSSMRC